MLPCLKVYELTFPFRTKVVERQDFILFTVSPALGKCFGCNKFTKLFAEWMNESFPQVHAFPCLMLFLVRFVLLVSVKGYCLEYRIWFWGLSLLFACKYPIHIMLQCCLLPSFHGNWTATICYRLTFFTAWQKNLCMCPKSLQSCSTLVGELMDYSPPGSSVHGMLQARIMEWITMPSSRESSWPSDWTHVSYVSCIGRQALYN